MQAGSQTVDSLFSLARKKLMDKEFANAIIIYNKIYEKDSLNFDLYVERGDAYFQLEEAQHAFDDFTKALTIRPESAEAYQRRGALLVAIRYNDEAIADNTMALDLAKSDTMRMASYWSRGLAKQQKRDFQGAFEDYSQAYFYDTSDIGIINDLAIALDELGRVDESMQYLRKVIQIEPDIAIGYVNLGFQQTRLKNYKVAIEYFNKALSLSKDHPMALGNRALARYHLKEYKAALVDVNKSILGYPANSYAYKTRALIYLALKQNDKVCPDLDRAKELGFAEAYGDEVDELSKTHCKK
jgi:tetratricopeptide (TPR) repeat protein